MLTTLTQDLIQTFNNTPSMTTGETPRLIEHARKNKVLLQLLRTLEIEGPLRQTQETSYNHIYEAVLEIAENIRDLDYAVIKFFKPMAYVPSDIDLLTKETQLQALFRVLHTLGYGPTVVEPNCVTFKGKTLVDIYTNPDFANIPYISGEQLLDCVQVVRINGIPVRTLTPEAEAVLALAHAIFKEQILTLNDYYTAKPYLDLGSMRIADRLEVLRVVQYSRKRFQEMERGLVEAPMKIPLRYVATLYSLKIAGNPLSRRCLPHVFLKLFDQRMPRLVKSRLFRQTY